MDKRVSVIIAILILCGVFFQSRAANQVKLETTFGDIVLELDSAKAPITVANFLSYVRQSFYNDVIFHRVIEDFMIQGGGLTEDMTQKPTDPAIRNEAFNGLQNVRGAIAMARTSEPHSATSQFFINTVDNAYLNYIDSSSNTNWGYCVFGSVIGGMDVVDSIQKVETETVGSYQDVPKTPIVITNAVEISTGIHSHIKTVPFTSVAFRKDGTSFFAVVQVENNACFELYNMNGRIIFSHAGIKPGRNVVPLKNLAAGIYVFGIKTGRTLIKKGIFLKQ